MFCYGITGTRFGMTEQQKTTMHDILRFAHNTSPNHEGIRIVHGDCIGTDKETHDIATNLKIETIIYPPTETQSRAFCEGTVIMPDDGYLARDRHIVRASNALLGVPQKDHETPRSGTWYTVRFALEKNIPVILILPDGEWLFSEEIQPLLLEGKWG